MQENSTNYCDFDKSDSMDGGVMSFGYANDMADYVVSTADDVVYAGVVMEEKDYDAIIDESAAPRKPRAVHQCSECNKIFVSFKGLQQHAIIHTDEKPFVCDVCHKAFRFKSNLFEHRSVHSGSTPHICPYCGKTCRLKGNLKKHLKTHVHTKEELDEAWRPFASNRRPPLEIPHDAIIVRSVGDPSNLFSPPSRYRKHRQLGLGTDPSGWIAKIQHGELLPATPLHEKMRRLADLMECADERAMSLEDVFVQARALPFERFDCPLCKSVFMSRLECADHLEMEHPIARLQRPLFCEICLKSFVDRKSMEQHQSYHRRVRMLMDDGDLQVTEPEILLPHLSYDNCDETDDIIEDSIML